MPLRGRRRARAREARGGRAPEEGERLEAARRGADRAHGRGPVRRAARHAHLAPGRGDGPEGRTRASASGCGAGSRSSSSRASQLGEAESEYLAAQAALRLARSSFERQEQLRKEQISSEKEYLTARQEHEAAQIRARSAQEKLARLGVAPGDVERLASAGRSSGDGALVVRAPADGIVLEMHAVPGELVKPDESIVTVGDVSSRVGVGGPPRGPARARAGRAARRKAPRRDRREGVPGRSRSPGPSTSSARRWTSGRAR